MVKRFTLENRAVKLFAPPTGIVTRSVNTILSVVVLIASVWIAFGQREPTLRLENTIALPGVQGRIDHMSFDLRAGRLFLAALGNNTVEVVDLNQGKRVSTIRGLHEPQGVLYLPDVNRLYVANGGNGTVQLFDGTSFQLLSTVNLGSDADNIRFDSERKQVYVGYGRGALAILGEDGSHIADVKLDAHPESFQLEQKGSRIFVNLPDSNKVAVVDRNTRTVIANWSTPGALANFPMALDEQNHRLFIVCRRPAEMLVLNTASGVIVARVPVVGDCDDVFYDADAKRLYASGGQGGVTIVQQDGPDKYKDIDEVHTRKGARTSFFVRAHHSLYIAARQEGAQPAAIYVYAVQH
jgi:DNA-binding beta-propeller fold protein YncE